MHAQALAIAVMLACSSTAFAQEPDAAAPAPKAQTTPRAQPKAPGAEAAPSGDSALRRRVEQLEAQIVDMQVVIGTLESLARSGPAGRPAAGASLPASESARIDGLETQIRALTAQVEQLAAGSRSNSPSPPGAVSSPSQTMTPLAPPAADAPAASFGSTTVTPGPGDALAAPPSTFGSENLPPAGADTRAPPSDLAAAGNPKQLYETAYGYLLQQNYKAAETAFGEFLKRYPNDSLSGNAQYWLGESHYVRGEYKAAASAFLKGYETYSANAKAPDSLLKLAMSLDRLGQKDAACSSYAELATKFPNAPPNVKTRAQSERQRVGCP